MTGRADRRKLLRHCEAIVATVSLPTPFTLDALCASIGGRRGRPLRLAAHPAAAGGPCGVWVCLPDEDIICIEPRTSPLHQAHVGLHEIAHILCGHDHAADHSGDLGEHYALRLLPGLDPTVVRRVLGRSRYDTPQEREAEIVATLLSERVVLEALNPIPTLGVDDPHVAEVLLQLAQALGRKGLD